MSTMRLRCGTMKRSRFMIATIVAIAAMLRTPVSAASVQASDPTVPEIVPTPRIVLPSDGRFLIGPHTTIILAADSEEERFAARQINDELAALNSRTLPVVPERMLRRLPPSFIYLGTPASSYGVRLLNERGARMTPELMKSITEEGYFLDVRTNGIAILAPSEKGKFYGVMTVLQMLRKDRKGIVVNAATIIDYPSHRLRGISDDISRGQVSTLENFKKILRFLARCKMNMYSPYLEDMVEFTRHPLIGKGRGALTAAELTELDTYARRYHIDIVPIFQTLGHWENILAIPAYVRYAEYPGGRTVNVADEKVYALLEEMIGELCRSLRSPYFNIGADETRDVGLGANKERVARLGLPAVLAAHYTRVADIVRRHGKIPMIYGDIILKNPSILTLIPRDIVIVDWNYDPAYHYDSPKVFTRAGFSVLASPGVLSYRGPFLDVFNSISNIQRFSRAAHADSAVGLLISSWNDYGGEQLRELNYYGYAWGAQCAWRAEGGDAASFTKAFFSDYFGTTETDAIETAYAILASPANHFSWFELWRHPMLPFLPRTPLKGHSPIVMERLQSITSTMPLVLSLLAGAEKSATRNRDHFASLKFIARLNLWFAKKVETLEEVQELSRWAPASAHRDSVADAIVRLSSGVLGDLADLRKEFAGLWMRTNKPEGLELLLQRYDRQAAYWREKIDQVRQGTFWIDPEIASAWIYHADTRDSAQATVRVQHAYFRKTFTASAAVRSSKLQLIGDTYVKVSVNGRPVGEVYVRRSNSLSAEHQRIKVFDIAPFLIASTNVITVEAQDYSVAGSAGVNLYGEVEYANGAIGIIASDTTWKTSAAPDVQWTDARYDDSRWECAIVKQYPYTVVRPDFATERPSWIEQ
jgi:hexosaminidase